MTSRTQAEGSDKPDLRSERTQAALWQSLVALIRDRAYQTITVKDLVDRARVNRATFYRYYEDKDDLLRQGALGVLGKVLDQAGVPEAQSVDQTMEDLPRYLARIFEIVHQERETFAVLAGPHGSPEFRHIITDKVEAILLDQRLRLWDTALGLFHEPTEAEALACMISSSLIRLLLWWLNQPNPLAPQVIGSLYRTMILGSMKELVAQRRPLLPRQTLDDQPEGWGP